MDIFGIPLELFALACGAALVAGFIKGAVGFAMPMVMVSALSSFLSVQLAIVGLLLPTLTTNGWQALRDGPRAAAVAAWEFRIYLGILAVCIVISAQFVAILPQNVLLLLLGAPLTVLATIQLLGWKPVVPPEARRRVEVIVAILAGLMGGLSGVWGPQTVMYLTAIDTEKKKQVRAQGVIFGMGALVLFLTHTGTGVLTRASGAFSATLVLPALVGLALGFAVQDRMDQALFRKATLVVLVIAGLNLVRRGLTG